jgi:hypothetical protein
MKNLLNMIIVFIFTVSCGARAATLSGDAKSTTEASYTFQETDDVNHISSLCTPNDNSNVSINIYVDGTLVKEGVRCGGEVFSLNGVKTLRFVINSTSLSEIQIIISGNTTKAGGNVHLVYTTLPPASACEVNYEPVISLGAINPTGQFDSTRIISSGKGNGVIKLKPSNLDGTGAFISTQDNSKIYMDVLDSNGVNSWSASQGIWSGSNKVDYFLNTKKTSLNFKPGIYNGSVTLTLECN